MKPVRITLLGEVHDGAQFVRVCASLRGGMYLSVALRVAGTNESHAWRVRRVLRHLIVVCASVEQGKAS